MNKKRMDLDKEKKSPKKGSQIFSVFTVFFCFSLAFFALYGMIQPDRQFSENENRVLTQKPVMTLHGLFDGSYMKEIESYLSDQFPFRDEAIYVKSLFERAWGKKEENGAYIGKNGFLFDRQSAYEKDKMIATASAVNSFVRKSPDKRVLFALVPNSTYIYSENLPSDLILSDQKQQVADFYKKLSKKIGKVNTFAPLIKAKNSHQVFYMTDHHWTTRGAFSVFEKIMTGYKIKIDKKNFEFHTVSNGFEGTLKSKSVAHNSTDNVEICFPKNSQGTYVVNISGDKKRTSCFFEEKLNEKNHYEVFFGGNYGKMTISTVAENDRQLLVIKDSFANCLIPMLTPYFSKIVVLDPRYMTENIYGIMSESDFTDILFLYNANTLFEDTSLVSVL